MSQPTQTMSRTDAIALLGVHYESRLDGISLREAKPKTLADKLLHLADFKADGIVHVREDLGAKQEDYEYATADEAAAEIAASMRSRYQARYDEINTLAFADETAAVMADATNPAQAAVRTAYAKALSTQHDIDAALRTGFTVEVHALKETLELPAAILSPGDKVHVLRGTDAIPTLSEETVISRRATPAFFDSLATHFSYALSGAQPSPANNNDDTVISVGPKSPHTQDGLAAAGKNTLVFNNAAAAKTALQNIVSDKLDALDAQKAALSQALGSSGLKRRTPSA